MIKMCALETGLVIEDMDKLTEYQLSAIKNTAEFYNVKLSDRILIGSEGSLYAFLRELSWNYDIKLV